MFQLNDDEYMVGCKVDDKAVFSIIEFITRKYKNHDAAYATTWFSKLKAKNSTKYKELEEYVVYAKLGGKTKALTPSTCIIGLQVVMGILDDEVGVQYRRQSRTAFTRIGGGDRALYDEIECNADSSDPNAVLLRHAYEQQKRAEGGASIPAPPQQVLAFRACCAVAALALTLERRCRCLLRRARWTWRCIR